MGHTPTWSAASISSEPTTHLCALCARRGKTCCQNHEIYLTSHDVERIRAHTGRDDFFEYKVPSDAGYQPDPSDPIWSRHAFRPDHSRRILRFDARGDCPFLTGQGCSLPLGTRPLVCRLHPHSYDHQGLCGLAHECPEELLTPGQDLLAALQMSDLDTARSWHAQLYSELRQEVPTR
jgi:Fe-S-cluster containining protein